jgi:hypothetical protein
MINTTPPASLTSLVPTAVLGIKISDPAEAAAITAAAGILLALLRAFAFVVTGKRERERALYGDAYRAAMAWRQMLYRVRTRAPGSEHELLKRFDKLQVRIDYYRGWTASEGRWIGRSYAQFVKDVQEGTSPLIERAWKMANDERLPWNDDRDSAGHPPTDAASDLFLMDVRNHLSLWLIPKFAVLWRNSKLVVMWRNWKAPKEIAEP